MTNEKPKIFKPTLAMIYYWKAYADPYTKANKSDCARRAVELMQEDGIPADRIPKSESIRQMVWQWEDKDEKENTGYCAWRDEFWKKLMRDSEKLLDKIGIQKSPADFRYWEVMQMKWGNFSRKQDNTNTNINLEDVLKSFGEDVDDKGDGYEKQPTA